MILNGLHSLDNMESLLRCWKKPKNIIVEYYEYFREISLIALIFTRFVKNTEPESGAREGEETGRSGRNFETDVFV